MADENVNEQNANAAGGDKKGGRMKSLVIVAAMMIAEGVGIFAIMKTISPAPDPAAAEDEAATADPFNLNKEVEISLCEITAFNKKEGRLYVYNAQISALVATQDREKIERFIEARELSIKDRVQVIFRSADPKDLSDPVLGTIKRQLRHEINNLLGGKELIREILIPKLLQSRANL